MNRRWCLSWVLLAAVAVSAAADDAATGHAWLAGQVATYNQARRDLAPADLAGRVVDDAVDLSTFADAVLQGYVEASLSDFEEHLDAEEHRYYVSVARQRIVEALRQRLVDDLSAALSAGTPGQLRVADASFDGTHGSVVLHDEGGGAGDLTVHLGQRQDGSWRIDDLDVGGRLLSQHYRGQYSDTIEGRYSPSVLGAQLRRQDYVVVEDFSASKEDELPLGWRWRDRDEGRRKPYRVHTLAGHTYLAAQDSGGSVMLLRFAHWNPRQYPIMTWCWRADSIPAGGDERFGHTNDSAAGIYVFFSQTWIGMPRHIKYVWSSTLKEGTIGRRDRIARPYFVVVESGTKRLGQWLFASVDLEDHYGRTWGGKPKDRTQGLGLLTDANSTDSRADAYYADVRVWTREAYEAGRVRDYCDCYRDLGSMTETDTVSGTAATPLRSGITP